MNQNYKGPFIIVFSLLMIWDVVTTGIGVVKIFGNINFGAVCIAILFAAAVWSLNFYSSVILSNIRDDFDKLINNYEWGNTEILIWILRPFWLGGIFFDFYTSWQGNQNLLGNRPNGMAALIVVFFTLLTTISPMTVYRLYQDDD